MATLAAHRVFEAVTILTLSIVALTLMYRSNDLFLRVAAICLTIRGLTFWSANMFIYFLNIPQALWLAATWGIFYLSVRLSRSGPTLQTARQAQP